MSPEPQRKIPDEDRSEARRILDHLRQGGVVIHPVSGQNHGPPAQEKDTFQERARVKDLAAEQGAKPEGVTHTTTLNALILKGRNAHQATTRTSHQQGHEQER